MAEVFLGLGSNLGDKEANIKAAVEALKELDKTQVLAVSQNFETKAMDTPKGTPDFVNAAVKIETKLNPEDLLEELQAIEIKLGRTEKHSFAPRTIDIDLLMYDDEIILDDELTVPHPLMHERYFVLAPLCDIAPDHPHPILGQSMQELLDHLWE